MNTDVHHPQQNTSKPKSIIWASLLPQMVKNPPAMQETWIRSLGWEDPLVEGMATHFSIPAWRIPMDKGTWWGPWGCKETEQLRRIQQYVKKGS